MARNLLFSPSRISGLRNRVDRVLEQTLVENRSFFLQRMHGEELYGIAEEFLQRPGKRLRPLLFLLSLKNLCPSISWRNEDLLRIAAGLEMLHAFILIHDDIIDNSDLRRGQPSLHRMLQAALPADAAPETGRNLAIVLGDIFFAMAQNTLLRTTLDDGVKVRLLQRVLSDTVETGIGEAGDIIFETCDVQDLSRADIEAMYMLKTTRYTFESPLVLAGIVAGFAKPELDLLAASARPAGLAFQIENDLRKFQKAALDASCAIDDLETGKKTLLIHTTWSLLSGERRSRFENALTTRPATETSLRELSRLIQDSGALPRLERRIEALFEKSHLLLEKSHLDPRHARSIQQLFAMVREMCLPPTRASKDRAEAQVA